MVPRVIMSKLHAMLPTSSAPAKPELPQYLANLKGRFRNRVFPKMMMVLECILFYPFGQ